MQCRSLIVPLAALSVIPWLASTPKGLQAATSRTLPTIPPGGLLHVHPENPRYFTDGSGRAIYLTGSHTWMNLQDASLDGRPMALDYAAFLPRCLF